MGTAGNRLKAKRKEIRKSDAVVGEFLRIVLLTTAGTAFSTFCSSTTHGPVLLSGGPGEMASGKQVKMDVKHGLARTTAVVDDQAVAF